MIINRSTAILLGEKQCGKTKFYRKICQKKEEMKESQLISTAFGNGFLVLDTNGFESQNDILPTLAQIFSVSSNPLNAILLVIKYKELSKMQKELNYELSVLKSYNQILILIISHWDLAEQYGEEQEKKKIINEIIQPLKLKNYLFSGLYSEGKSICKEIDSIITRGQNLGIDFFQNDIQKQLENLKNLDEIDTVDIESQFQLICEGACSFIESLINKQEGDIVEQMHELCLAVIDYAELQVMEFTKTHSKTFDQLLNKYGNCQYTYQSYTKLKIKLMTRANRVIQKAETHRSNLHLPFGQNIKECHNCGSILVKLNDCPYVSCGQPSSNFDKQEQTRLRNYKFTFTGTNVQMTKLNAVPSDQQIDQSKIEQKKINQKIGGCGVSLNWDTLPILSETVQIKLISELFKDLKQNNLTELQEKQNQLIQELFYDPRKYIKQQEQLIVETNIVPIQNIPVDQKENISLPKSQPPDPPQRSESCCSRCMIY